MIGLLFLAGISLWLAIAVMLSKKIPVWIGVSKHKTATTVLIFPVLFVLPMADEIIGRWQFSRLCEREAVVTLNPDWEKVKGARLVSQPRREVSGTLIQIYSEPSKYVDVATGTAFMTYPYFYTHGGMLLGRLGLGLGGLTSCHPKNAQAIQKMINFYELLKQGEMK